ncbi:ABC transporter substrate-binding protein, partial [Halomonas sp. BC04]|uniref:ABC transporter substrate-binding protein n=1 Tax=Halomonas sp. BC04 TaxID=1403540 RepID=UPI003FA5BD7E
DPIRYEAAFIIAERWRELGLEVNVQPTEFSTALERFYDQQDFDVTILGWSGRTDRLDPQFFLSTLDSRQAHPGGNNPGGYENPEFDALFDQQSQAFDMDERQRIVHEMQALYMPDMPVAVLFHRDEVVAFNHDAFEGINPMAGEGLYSEWGPWRRPRSVIAVPCVSAAPRSRIISIRWPPPRSGAGNGCVSTTIAWFVSPPTWSRCPGPLSR